MLILLSGVLMGCSKQTDSMGKESLAGEPTEEAVESTEEGLQQEENTEQETPTEATEEQDVVEEDMNKTYTLEGAAYASFTGFIDEYYFKSKVLDYGIFLDAEKKQLHFWDQAEIYEVVIDAYERTGDKRYYDMILEIFDGFTRTHGTDWEWNEYNDDIMWMTIACTRAYNDTGDQAFLDMAKTHFDMVWDRAWTDDLGGGLFWRTDNTSKNACVNCPGAIAACLLGDALDDESYYEKAKMMVKWVDDTLYVDGRIWDNMEINGTKHDWNFTYNQGTYIGATTLLYLHTGEGSYLSRARKAVDYTMNDMYHYGVMDNENSGGDLIGFKGILTRWMYLFGVTCDQPDVLKWLEDNAMTAWSNRNSDGIMQTTWGTKTEDGADVPAFSASTAVAVLHNTKEGGKSSSEASNVKASKFDRCGKLLVTEKTEDAMSIETLADNAYLEFATVKFGETATKVKVKAGAETETVVEIRLDAPDGELVATTTIAAGTMDSLQEVEAQLQELSKKQRIYLVFPNSGTKLKISGIQFGS